MLATMYYNYCALLMAEMAKAINNEAGVAHYSGISEKIKTWFCKTLRRC